MSFKINFRCGNLPLCRGVIAVPIRVKIPYIHSNLSRVCPPSQDGVINREKVYLDVVSDLSVRRGLFQQHYLLCRISAFTQSFILCKILEFAT